jgi:hypothetical protein
LTERAEEIFAEMISNFWSRDFSELEARKYIERIIEVSETKKIELFKRLLLALPLCPDHRGKRKEGCVLCENEILQKQLKEVKRENIMLNEMFKNI